MARLFQNKPSRLYTVAGVDGSAIDGVDKLAVWTHCFKQSLVFGVHEIVFNGIVKLLKV